MCIISQFVRKIVQQLTLSSTVTPGQVVMVSSQTIATNCPLMNLSSCQSVCVCVRPCLPPPPLCSPVSSSRSLSQLPITFCPRLWQSNMCFTLKLGSFPGCFPWVPTHSIHSGVATGGGRIQVFYLRQHGNLTEQNFWQPQLIQLQIQFIDCLIKCTVKWDWLVKLCI